MGAFRSQLLYYHFKLETRKNIPEQTDIYTVESFKVPTLDLNP